MSKYKDQTENIPPLSSGAGTGAKAQPSKQLASSDNTPNYTQTTRMQSETTLTTGLKGADNSPTTPKITEKSLQHALIMRVALSQLEKAGLLKRYKVLSKDGTKTNEIQVVFDPELWTENLELKVLSEGDNSGQHRANV